MFLPCVLWLFCSVFCLGVLRVFVFWLAVLFWNWHYFEVIFAPTFEPPKRDIVNAFANSFNQHNKVRRPGESHRGAGRKKKVQLRICFCFGENRFRAVFNFQASLQRNIDAPIPSLDHQTHWHSAWNLSKIPALTMERSSTERAPARLHVRVEACQCYGANSYYTADTIYA